MRKFLRRLVRIQGTLIRLTLTIASRYNLELYIGREDATIIRFGADVSFAYWGDSLSFDARVNLGVLVIAIYLGPA